MVRKNLKNQRRLIDSFKAFKKETIGTMDMLVLQSLGKTEYDDFKEYKHDMENMEIQW